MFYKFSRLKTADPSRDCVLNEETSQEFPPSGPVDAAVHPVHSGTCCSVIHIDGGLHLVSERCALRPRRPSYRVSSCTTTTAITDLRPAKDAARLKRSMHRGRDDRPWKKQEHFIRKTRSR